MLHLSKSSASVSLTKPTLTQIFLILILTLRILLLCKWLSSLLLPFSHSHSPSHLVYHILLAQSPCFDPIYMCPSLHSISMRFPQEFLPVNILPLTDLTDGVIHILLFVLLELFTLDQWYYTRFSETNCMLFLLPNPIQIRLYIGQSLSHPPFANLLSPCLKISWTSFWRITVFSLVTYLALVCPIV